MSKAGRYAKNLGTHWRSRAQQVGLAAEGLNTRGESYCADVQSDGLVHDAFLGALCGGAVDKRALAELIRAGWWVRVEGGHEIVGYLERNISKADDEKRRNGGKARVAKHRGGDVTADARNGVGNASGNDACNALQSAQRAPLPLTLSVEDRPKTLDPGESAQAREAPGALGLIEAAYASALGEKRGKYIPNLHRDNPHWRSAKAACEALAEPGEVLRDASLRLARAYVTERRSRSPEWFAEWLQKRAASGDSRAIGGRVEPLPNAAYRGTPQAEIDAMFGEVTEADYARIDGKRRAHG